MNSKEVTVAVVVLIDDEVKYLNDSLISLVEQTGLSFEITPVFIGSDKRSYESAKKIVRSYFENIDLVRNNECLPISDLINKVISAGTTSFISLMRNGDRFHPERLVRLVNSAQEREADVLFTYAELIDYKSRIVGADNPFFKHYSTGLLNNIAAHPCLSFSLLYFDLILSSGNILFTRQIFERVGGFHNHKILFVYDFVLRASRIKEPIVLTQKTILCKPVFVDRFLRETQESIDERALILKDYLISLVTDEPENPLSNVFVAHPFMFSGIAWNVALSQGIDGIIETFHPRFQNSLEKTIPKFELPISKNAGSKITLLTHELSLTGAPVIVLEMAHLLIENGCSVSVLSPSDGPLRDEFERRGVDVIVLPSLHSKLKSLERYVLTHPENGYGLLWFAKKSVYFSLVIFNKILDYIVRRKLNKIIDGPVLVNSIAAWPWVFRILKAKSSSVIWYIHETFDPKWIATGPADKLFRMRVAQGALKMIYGSNATREMWTSEGYPGLTKYWSGIKSGKYEGNQFLNGGKKTNRRVILNVGMFGSRKGTRVLLEAFSYGRMNGIIPKDVELCIIGSPKISSSQEARDIFLRICRPDLYGSVRIVGHLQPGELEYYYDEAEVYAHASFFDCMPIAILTAMARGLPIVATNVDGCGEAIIDQVTGILVPPRSPEMLANAIGSLLNDKVLASTLASGASAHFRNVFSTEATFDGIREVIGS